MGKLAFYFQYAWRNIRRGGRWTLLAVICIAAGVATVVALRSLGLSIGDALVSNVRQDIKGDIVISKTFSGQSLNTTSEERDEFSPEELQAIRQYVDERNARSSEFVRGGNIQVTPVEETEGDGQSAGGVGGFSFGTSGLIETYLINPETYPTTHTIEAIEPRGVPLSELFTGGNELVISENMADNQGLSLGDQVRIARTEELFEVVGIISADEESSLTNPFAAFFGFAYFDLDVIRNVIDESIQPTSIVIAFPEPLTQETQEPVIEELRDLATRTTDQFTYDTAPNQLERNEVISTILGDFIVTMGLGALLIGGVGIMNTMLVLVRRRTNEIAALKTFGLKGGQVGWLFVAESVLLGFIGSVVGSVIGVLLGGIVNQFGEQFLQQSLVWTIHPEALLYGFVLGLLITGVFGFVPIAMAIEVRPGIILRPNENHAPRLGIFRSIAMIIIIVVVLGLIVGRILSPSVGVVSSITPTTLGRTYLFSIIGVAVTFVILGILIGLLWIVVWLVGKLPAFGSVDLRLALRNLSTHRTRTATTLLALSAGMFALSSITFVGEGTRELLNFQLSRSFGGNVVAIPVASGNNLLLNLSENAINRALEDVPGINYRTTIANYELREIIGVDGRDLNVVEFTPDDFEDYEAYQQALNDLEEPVILNRFEWSGIGIWDSENPNAVGNAIDIVEGRNLRPEDRGNPVMVIPSDPAVIQYGQANGQFDGSDVAAAESIPVGVGSQITYRVNDEPVTFEVIGIYEFDENSPSFGLGDPLVAPETIDVRPEFVIFSFDVDEEYTSQAVTELSSLTIPPIIALDVSFFDTLISRLINTFAALPTVVGLLSLFAAAVIMANTVALATLERRRQIGILKSVGLKSWRVLIIMLIESTIIGLLSALFGVGLSYLGIELLGRFTDTPLPFPTQAQIVAVVLVVAAIGIGWVATFASANVAVRERVMNVLRYE